MILLSCASNFCMFCNISCVSVQSTRFVLYCSFTTKVLLYFSTKSVNKLYINPWSTCKMVSGFYIHNKFLFFINILRHQHCFQFPGIMHQTTGLIQANSVLNTCDFYKYSMIRKKYFSLNIRALLFIKLHG